MRTTDAARAYGAALPRSIAMTILAVCRTMVLRRAKPPCLTDLHRIDDRTLRDIGVSRTDLMAASRLGRTRRSDRNV